MACFCSPWLTEVAPRLSFGGRFEQIGRLWIHLRAYVSGNSMHYISLAVGRRPLASAPLALEAGRRWLASVPLALAAGRRWLASVPLALAASRRWLASAPLALAASRRRLASALLALARRVWGPDYALP